MNSKCKINVGKIKISTLIFYTENKLVREILKDQEISELKTMF